MNKYCPKCYERIDDNDMCFNGEKPHPRCNKSYYCSTCKEVLCWIDLIEEKEIQEQAV